MNGLLVPPRDSKAFAAALLVLINDPKLRSEMGRENRSKVETEFANEIIIRQTQSVYDSFGQ
jgi:glycosyltransferase involved in cell wall biosynthesis